MEQGIPGEAEVYVALITFAFVAIVVLVTTAITILIWCKLCTKAGYSWALGLLTLVPIANIVLPFYLAFADWPVQKELRQLRQQRGGLQT